MKKDERGFVELASSLYNLDVNRRLSVPSNNITVCPAWQSEGSLLSVAAWSGCEEVVEWLIKAQTDVNININIADKVRYDILK